MSSREKNEKLSIREKIALHFIVLALKIVNPTGYTHEIDKNLEIIKKQIKEDED